MHRIVPNWSAAALLVKNNKVEETVQNPRKMMMAGSVVGALVVIFLNTMASIIPEKLSLIASEVLGPATTWLINPSCLQSSGWQPLTLVRLQVCGVLFWVAYPH